jgi:hypothetical protein
LAKPFGLLFVAELVELLLLASGSIELPLVAKLVELALITESVELVLIAEWAESALVAETIELILVAKSIELVLITEPVELIHVAELVELTLIAKSVEPVLIAESVELALVAELIELTLIAKPVEPILIAESVELALVTESVELTLVAEAIEPVFITETIELIRITESVELPLVAELLEPFLIVLPLTAAVGAEALIAKLLLILPRPIHVLPATTVIPSAEGLRIEPPVVERPGLLILQPVEAGAAVRSRAQSPVVNVAEDGPRTKLLVAPLLLQAEVLRAIQRLHYRLRPHGRRRCKTCGREYSDNPFMAHNDLLFDALSVLSFCCSCVSDGPSLGRSPPCAGDLRLFALGYLSTMVLVGRLLRPLMLAPQSAGLRRRGTGLTLGLTLCRRRLLLVIILGLRFRMCVPFKISHCCANPSMVFPESPLPDSRALQSSQPARLPLHLSDNIFLRKSWAVGDQQNL